jgi:hypothetical protein
MENGSRKSRSKNRGARITILVLVALALALWPARTSGIEANVNMDISPTGVPKESLPEVGTAAGVSPMAAPVRNLWGAPKGEDVDVSLYRSESGLGWNWSRPDPEKRAGINYIQPIYPNARITLKKPVAIGDIQSFNLFADFHYTQPPTGKYNLAFDIFLRKKGIATDNRESEIMVWLDWTLSQPASSFKGVRSDGANDYAYYAWKKKDSFDYNSFLLKARPSSTVSSIDLKALIDLVRPDENWYISEVELGTEVWDGSGAIDLTTFYLELNGIRQ